jgi:hypothetical protein
MLSYRIRVLVRALYSSKCRSSGVSFAVHNIPLQDRALRTYPQEHIEESRQSRQEGAALLFVSKQGCILPCSL